MNSIGSNSPNHERKLSENIFFAGYLLHRPAFLDYATKVVAAIYIVIEKLF